MLLAFENIAKALRFLRSLDVVHGNPKMAITLTIDNIENELAYIEREYQRMQDDVSLLRRAIEVEEDAA